MREQDEASVEEILDSIKKVMARDKRASAAELRQERASRGISGAVPEPVDADEAEEILDLSEGDYIAEDAGSEIEDAADQGDADSHLTNPSARDAMRENLAALAMLAEPGKQPQIVRSGETSLEGLTREMLRPMLADWLDANLPGMVEEMVQAEIARIAGKRG